MCGPSSEENTSRSVPEQFELKVPLKVAPKSEPPPFPPVSRADEKPPLLCPPLLRAIANAVRDVAANARDAQIRIRPFPRPPPDDGVSRPSSDVAKRDALFISLLLNRRHDDDDDDENNSYYYYYNAEWLLCGNNR